MLFRTRVQRSWVLRRLGGQHHRFAPDWVTGLNRRDPGENTRSECSQVEKLCMREDEMRTKWGKLSICLFTVSKTVKTKDIEFFPAVRFFFLFFYWLTERWFCWIVQPAIQTGWCQEGCSSQDGKIAEPVKPVLYKQKKRIKSLKLATVGRRVQFCILSLASIRKLTENMCM